MKARQLYIFSAFLCFVGWGWLLANIFLHKHRVGVVMCVSKSITDVPCPSCGTTRSVLSFFEGDFIKSLYWNPLGVLVSLVLLVFPFWILYDLFFRKKTLYQMYVIFENFFKKPYFYIPFLVLLLLNWIWNIYKGL